MDMEGVAMMGMDVVLDGKEEEIQSMRDRDGVSCGMEVAGVDAASSTFKGTVGGLMGDSTCRIELMGNIHHNGHDGGPEQP